MLDNYELLDRYRRESGRVLLTGTQALVRIPLMQRTMDRAAGLDTAGFISGYRGSPLGMVDLELWRAQRFLEENGIEFLPAVNEDLAATAVLGSQQVETDPDKQVDGVFGIWYGKGPGVDRAGDALKHGNAYGSSPNGGVLVVAGDDHGCISSSMPHQSDVAFLTFMMPWLNPASVAEYLEYGLYGIALSRFSGMWVGFKAITETVESAMSVELPPYPQFVTPADYQPPHAGLHYRWPDFPGPQIEERLEAKKAATLAFAAANPIDKKIFDVPDARFGIVTTGKGHLDLMEALRLLGIDETQARRIGIDVYKVGLVWPLEPEGALDFVKNKREVLVVEEKRGIIESQFKEYFYDYPGRKPERMVGKEDEEGDRLVPWTGELSPLELVPLVAQRLDRVFGGSRFSDRAGDLQRRPCVINVAGAQRIPFFCSGCPHNSSTKVPEGSKALAGIGCHFMASWMDRDTDGLIQMGGEGVNWVARSKFNGDRHVFQNLGDGTFYHSGSVAIRQAIAAGTNITYKILFNDAVAMTGGQPVDGPLSVDGIAQSVRAEGVDRIAVVSDEPERFDAGDFPPGTTISHRRELDAVQRELRDIPGVTVLVYAQMCATEKRRRRKRGKLEDPGKFVVINELVCEGCGDCSVESNCLSVVPKETPLGRKRQIDQHSCNKDFSCVNGFCPSFVTVEGNIERADAAPGFAAELARLSAALPAAEVPAINHCYDLLVTGVGGTGVITVGALITMAAHLERKGASELDFMGFAQKFGPVLSYLRIANEPAHINQVRIEKARADALIGCDLVVSSSPKASITYKHGHTRALVNLAEMPTGNFVQQRDATLRSDERISAIEAAVGDGNLATLDANSLARRIMGDAIYANVMMTGAAWQLGLVPVSLDALMRAIELNGVKIDENKQAFTWGRIAAHDPDGIQGLLDGTPDDAETLDAMLERRRAYLVDYQDEALAERYVALVRRVREAEAAAGTGERLAAAVARAYFRLLAYKDEYEVARLHTDPAFLDRLRGEFGRRARWRFHLAPPLLGGQRDARGRPLKREFGRWILPLFRMLARLRGLRGTAFDLFGYTAERRMERRLIVEFEETVDAVLAALGESGGDAAAEVIEPWLDIRGFGPVKETAVDEVRQRVAAALAKLAQREEKAA
ncbi:MAG: indolepyruvate ferredoxin oxidoreductase family protein [Gammaproteobacteria bacterium]|nr:indolepyruvate ferredoxin oxidoreductase family protein [Gammaproteobacteria bacterium]MBT8094731.1 indolepyruvate ferredoxin oxidoreductase family protein [Gammaproteobacteria bacterium]MBT8104306.1 indolepyruvate ferredoxin oxidoreductase family protein [Gammaproteobacteria bacterium]NNK24322.1 indolepyruvate ferredoxin oxidoreductase family protein [Woeseiaceae bacterium]